MQFGLDRDCESWVGLCDYEKCTKTELPQGILHLVRQKRTARDCETHFSSNVHQRHILCWRLKSFLQLKSFWSSSSFWNSRKRLQNNRRFDNLLTVHFLGPKMNCSSEIDSTKQIWAAGMTTEMSHSLVMIFFSKTDHRKDLSLRKDLSRHRRMCLSSLSALP